MFCHTRRPSERTIPPANSSNSFATLLFLIFCKQYKLPLHPSSSLLQALPTNAPLQTSLSSFRAQQRMTSLLYCFFFRDVFSLHCRSFPWPFSVGSRTRFESPISFHRLASFLFILAMIVLTHPFLFFSNRWTPPFPTLIVG